MVNLEYRPAIVSIFAVAGVKGSLRQVPSSVRKDIPGLDGGMNTR